MEYDQAYYSSSEVRRRRRFGESVKELRENRGITLHDAANMADLSVKTYIRIERGERTKNESIAKLDGLFGFEPGTSVELVRTGHGYDTAGTEPSDQSLDNADTRSKRAMNRIVRNMSDLTVRDLRRMVVEANEALRVRLSGQLEQAKRELDTLRASTHRIADDIHRDDKDSKSKEAFLASHQYAAYMLEERILELESELHGYHDNFRLENPRREHRRELKGDSYGDYATTS